MTSWRDITLGQLVSLQRGHDLPSDGRKHGNIPVMGSFGITGWHNVARAKGPGVTVGRSGTSVGVVSYIDRDYWPLNTCLFATDFHGNNPKFVYYLLQTLDLAAHNSGSAQPSLNRNFIAPIRLQVPERQEQNDVVDLLGSLDDKIELNRRTNETLEAMSQAIFRDWFVDLGPTRRKIHGVTDPVEIMGGLVADPDRARELAELFPASLGDDGLPGGWSYGSLGDLVVNVVERCVPSEATRHRPYVPIDTITARSLIIQDGRPGSEAQSSLVAFRRNDILFGAMRPYFHKVALANFDGTTRTTVFVLRPKAEADLGFALMTINDETTIEYATQHSSGTTIPYAVWRGSLERMTVLRPPSIVRGAYGQIIQPMLDRMLASASQNRALAGTRDLLLPKLISGEIRVHAAASASE